MICLFSEIRLRKLVDEREKMIEQVSFKGNAGEVIYEAGGFTSGDPFADKETKIPARPEERRRQRFQSRWGSRWKRKRPEHHGVTEWVERAVEKTSGFFFNVSNKRAISCDSSPGDSSRQINDLKFKLVKAEQEVTALEQNVSKRSSVCSTGCIVEKYSHPSFVFKIGSHSNLKLK